jgi:hypothetical protein
MEVSIEYRGVSLMVGGTYEPEEPMVMYYADMSGYPGSASDFEIDTVFVGDIEISDILIDDQLLDIRNLVLESIEDGEMYNYEDE